MSREIKFRVWDIPNQCWSDLFHAITDDGALWHFPNSGLAERDDTEQYTVEQYTGLKDKNGKEIYEGDIFRNTINGGTWRVSWNEKDAAFWIDSGVAGCSLGEFDWDRSNRKYGFIRKNCEVIGNVHENPELLGGKE